jgi:muramoyltetrapeptide carboxypeptidase
MAEADIRANEIRIIAPSSSMRGSPKRQYERAQERIESLGYEVTFGKYVNDQVLQGTALARDRAQDLNDAYADTNVMAVMAAHGGWAANEILPYLNWELIRDNPKPLIGFSDITVLLNAIYAKTGVRSYLGPNYASVGSMRSWEYTLSSLSSALRGEATEPTASRVWGVGKEKKGHRTKAWKVIQPGTCKAPLLGGNAGTFYLLQGTGYQPKFDTDFVLAFEDDDESGKYTAREFSRRLESVLQLPNVRDHIRGMLIGRFQPDSRVTDKELESILQSKHLEGIPVVSRVDFGHTLPILTLPIGGIVEIIAGTTKVVLRIENA